MPTGYTADVGDGKVTDFRTFALRCARQFGACIMQRDDPMDEPPKPREVSPHYGKSLAGARKELQRVLSMDGAALEAAAEAEYEAALAQHVQYAKNRKETKRRYQAMLREVRDWTPPTADHRRLKEFMDSQLTESIDFDCKDYGTKPPQRLTGLEWKAAQRERLEREIAYNTQAEQEEAARANSANAWITALYDSLPAHDRP